MSLIKIAVDLFQSWNKNNICYCHWKGNEHIDKSFSGHSDFDILVSKTDKSKAEDILLAFNFKCVKTQYGLRILDVFDWIGFDNETGHIVHIHLHFRSICGHLGLYEYELPWQEDLLKTRVFDTKYSIFKACPEVELITFISRLYLDFPSKKCTKRGNKYVLSEKSLKELHYLFENSDEAKLNYYISKYFGNSVDFMKEQVFKFLEGGAIEKNDIKFVLNCVRETGNHYINQFKIVYYKIFFKGIANYLHEKNFILLKKSSVGLKIAFIGQDGAGKSTVTKEIEKWLSWKFDVKNFYLGSGDLFNPWEKKVQNLLKNTNNLFFKILRQLISVKMLSKLALNVYKTVRKAENYKLKGGIALFDRYPQNSYVGINDGPKIRAVLNERKSAGFLKLFLNYFAKEEEKFISKAVDYQPDIVFKLVLPPEESIRRKPFENFEGIVKKHEIINKMEFPESEVFLIDATQDFNLELLQIKNLIWKRLR